MRFKINRRQPEPRLTSDTHPIPLDTIEPALLGTPGKIILTYAPGKRGPRLSGGVWDRNLSQDLRRLEMAGVTVLVNLMEPFELDMLGIPTLEDACSQFGIMYHNAPIQDLGSPQDLVACRNWIEKTASHLREGKHVAIHCRGGRGRTGTFATALLVHLGWDPREALDLVRSVRKSTVETAGQENFVLNVYPAFLRGEPIPSQNPTIYDMQDLTDLFGCNLHTDLDSWKTTTPPDQRAYGGVLFNEDGMVLLREPSSHWDGYVWTFPKGRGDDPVETAIREVLEETGYDTEIIGFIPGGFIGGTSETFYFLMRPVGYRPDEMDFETSRVFWATPEQARGMIEQTTNDIGRKRDLLVLDSAVATLHWLLEAQE